MGEETGSTDLTTSLASGDGQVTAIAWAAL